MGWRPKGAEKKNWIERVGGDGILGERGLWLGWLRVDGGSRGRVWCAVDSLWCEERRVGMTEADVHGTLSGGECCGRVFNIASCLISEFGRFRAK